MKAVLRFLKSDAFVLVGSLTLLAAAVVLSVLEVPIAYVVCCVLAVAVAGWPVCLDAVRGLLRRDLLDEKFLMTIACIGALCLGELIEAAAVMIFYQIGEYFQRKAVARSRASVRSLMDIRPDTATVIRDGEEMRVDADDVEIGEQIVVRTGERIPIDAIVERGQAELNTSALTGESLPRHAAPSDAVESGVVVLEGVLYLRTVKTADTSAAARVLELVESATENKAKEELFITKFARVYTPIVVGLAVLLAFVVPLFDGFDFLTYIQRALIFLVISCPCALVISVPMTFFGGIGGAASRGILYKGGHLFSPLANVHTAVFDKTGTLTEGRLSVVDVSPVSLSPQELLRLAAVAEYGSNHPIAKCLKDAVKTPVTPPKTTEELSGLGIEAFDGEHRIAVGNVAMMEHKNIILEEKIKQNTGGVLLVAIDGAFAGTITLADTVKAEAAEAIRSLRLLGVRRTVMFSGDTAATAEQVGARVGIDEVHAQLLPHEKYEKLEHMMDTTPGSVLYVGDGINDAPSIARADVGVAMGCIGQDSAIEAADVVIMADSLDKLPTAVRIARKTLRIAKENIVFALTVKIAVMVLGALGLAGMWLAVFADVGVAVLAILNAMRALRARETSR